MGRESSGVYIYVNTCYKHVCYRALLNECCGIGGIEMSKVQKNRH